MRMPLVFFTLAARTIVRYNINMRIIMHVDANSAFLSWSSAEALKHGETLDYRTVASVVGGDEESRHGIVLARSVAAKKVGIVTAEPLVSARRKCPGLLIVKPDYATYEKYSDAMYEILSQYTPIIQRYSIDECFLDYTASRKLFGDPVKVAYEIGRRMKEELGFTVNIGVSTNKVLAKMGSEMEKPDKVHTMWPEEIGTKMWPLDVGELFMVGRKSADRLRKLGIYTIGDLAKADMDLLYSHFNSYAELLHNYSNGIDDEEVEDYSDILQKGFGHAETIEHNVTDRDEALKYLLKVCEKLSGRLRDYGAKASLVSITIRNSDLLFYGRQRKLDYSIDSTEDIYVEATKLFDEIWQEDPIRQLGVSTSHLVYDGDNEQISMFGEEERAKHSKTDATLDAIRKRFGVDSIKRGSLLEFHHNNHPHEG